MERLELVTNFGSLKVGDLVVVKCPCGNDVRGILVRQETVLVMFRGYEPVWFREPPHYCGGFRKPHVISAEVVRRRIVYRVDTGLEREETISAGARRPETVDA